MTVEASNDKGRPTPKPGLADIQVQGCCRSQTWCPQRQITESGCSRFCDDHPSPNWIEIQKCLSKEATSPV